MRVCCLDGSIGDVVSCTIECTEGCAQVRSAAGDWGEVRIPRSVKALVLLNIQSYAGGRDLWGLADTGHDARKGWRTPIFNDGLIEARPSARRPRLRPPRPSLSCGNAHAAAFLFLLYITISLFFRQCPTCGQEPPRV